MKHGGEPREHVEQLITWSVVKHVENLSDLENAEYAKVIEPCKQSRSTGRTVKHLENDCYTKDVKNTKKALARRSFDST